MKTFPYPIRILAIITLLLFTLFIPKPSQGQGQNNDGNQQNRAIPGLDVIILVDESETMWNTTDPEGVRVNTVNFFIDVLSSEQSGDGHRAAVIAFGTNPQVIPFVLLDSPEATASLKEQYLAAHNQIEPNKNLQYTDINAALQAALTLLDQQRDPTRKPGIILISDGQPTNPDVSEEKGQEIVEDYLSETQGLLDQLNQHEYEADICSNTNGVPLYTIGMGIDNLQAVSSPEFVTLYREFWQGVASRTNGYYREARELQEMQGISTYIFSELLCTPALPPLGIRESQVLEYQVYSSYFQIIFTISAKEQPDLKAQIYRPNSDGTPGDILLNPDDEGVSWQTGPDYEIWRVTFTEPWEGPWQVTLEGEGQAEFSYVVFPNVTINIDEPNSGFLPVDRPISLQASIADENGQLISVPLNDFWVEVEGEDFRQQVRLEEDSGTYTAQLNSVGQTGEYSLTFSTLLPDGTPLFEHKFVTLISAPWAEVLEPAPNTSLLPGETIPLKAQAHLVGAVPVDGVTMIASLKKDGETVQTIELNRGDILNQADTEALVAYSGQFQAVEESGDYTIQTKLMAILPGGRVFDDETPLISLSIAPPPTATPTNAVTPTATPTSTSTSTSTPTATPVAAAVVAPANTPTPVPPTPTPTPVPWLASVVSPSSWPFWLLLLLLLLLIAFGVFFWYRNRQPVPDSIKMLAALMHSRRNNNEPPYVLVLGSGASLLLGSGSMKHVVEVVGHNSDLDQYYQRLDSLSPHERYVILKQHFDDARLSSGYKRLAELVEAGYFKLIFTTNLDPFIEQSLAGEQDQTLGYEVLICGTQPPDHTSKRLAAPAPPIKIIKLHGDIETRNFAFTPSEISKFGSESERILRQYLSQDLIIIGNGSRDYDINRAIEQEGGSIWYIDQEPPDPDVPLYRAMDIRGTEGNIISGEFGMFDRFFGALYKELKRL